MGHTEEAVASVSPSHSIQSMSEEQLVAFLQRLSESSSVPLRVDQSAKVVEIYGRMSGGVEFMVNQAVSRLQNEFGFRNGGR